MATAAVKHEKQELAAPTLSETMKAVQQHAFGGPEVLRYEDAPVPALQAGEVLVRVHAVSL
nr:hypothetical protein [Tanacetum cinerariifolium]